MEPNPYVIAACIVLIVLSWIVLSVVLAFAFGAAVSIAELRRNRPRYRRSAR